MLLKSSVVAQANILRSRQSLQSSLLTPFSRQGFSVALELALELALVDQAGHELRDLLATVSSGLLGLKACATTAQPVGINVRPPLYDLTYIFSIYSFFKKLFNCCFLNYSTIL